MKKPAAVTFREAEYEKLNSVVTLIVCLKIFIQIHIILWREHIQTQTACKSFTLYDHS